MEGRGPESNCSRDKQHQMRSKAPIEFLKQYSNPLRCPCPGHFAEVRRGRTGHCPRQKVLPGGWAIFQPPGHFFLHCSEVSRGKTVPCGNGPHRPRHRVSAYGCHSGRRRSTNGLTTRNWGFTVWVCDSNWNQQLLAEMILPKKSAAVPSVFRTFWECFQIDQRPLSNYNIVNFSMLSFSKLNFSICFYCLRDILFCGLTCTLTHAKMGHPSIRGNHAVLSNPRQNFGGNLTEL